MITLFKKAVVFIFVIHLFTGCTETATSILNNAIGKLELQSANWQAVLTQTKEDLIKAGETTISNEVSKVLGDALGDAGATGMCGVDYLRSRAKEDLIRIRAKITGEKLTLQPHFCSPVPAEIDMNLTPDRRPSIKIYGFNFDAAQNMQVFIIENNGTQREVTKNASGVSNIAFPTHYLLTLNLGSNGVILNSNSKQLLFKLSDEVVQTINIIQPPITIGVKVNVHIQGVGWQGWIENPDDATKFAGTTQQGAQIEAIQVMLMNAPSNMHINYQSYLQDIGWENKTITDGGVSGTIGQGRRLEAFKIWLTNASGSKVSYKSYLQNIGWEGSWKADGAVSGTLGQGRRVEAINVKIINP